MFAKRVYGGSQKSALLSIPSLWRRLATFYHSKSGPSLEKLWPTHLALQLHPCMHACSTHACYYHGEITVDHHPLPLSPDHFRATHYIPVLPQTTYSMPKVPPSATLRRQCKHWFQHLYMRPLYPVPCEISPNGSPAAACFIVVLLLGSPLTKTSSVATPTSTSFCLWTSSCNLSSKQAIQCPCACKCIDTAQSLCVHALRSTTWLTRAPTSLRRARHCNPSKPHATSLALVFSMVGVHTHLGSKHLIVVFWPVVYLGHPHDGEQRGYVPKYYILLDADYRPFRTKRPACLLGLLTRYLLKHCGGKFVRRCSCESACP